MSFDAYLNEKDFIQIPDNWMPSTFYTFTYEGWGPITYSADDSQFTQMFQMAANTLDAFIKMYKESRVFTKPVLCYKHDGTFYLKVGTLEKEEYEIRKKNA